MTHTVGITQSEDDGDHFTIIDNGDTDADGVDVYEVGEVNLEVVYNGNRAEDEYLLKAQMNGEDASYWDVSFWVGSERQQIHSVTCRRIHRYHWQCRGEQQYLRHWRGLCRCQ